MPFDVAGARAAGYSDTEIASFLGSQIGFDVDGAVKAGYKPAEIVGFLSDASNKGPVPQGDPLTRVSPSTPATDSVSPITPQYDAGGGRGRINPQSVNTETVSQTADRLDKNVTGSVISGVREMAGAAGIAAMAPAKAIDFVHGLITGKDETGAQDYVGRTFVDPNFTAAEQWAPKPEDETHVAGKVLNGLARMAPTLAAAMVTGGASAPEQGAMGLEAVRQAIVHGMRSMSVPAFSAGIAKSADLIQKGAPLDEAVVAGLTEGGTTDLTGGLAMSAPGANAATRFVQGAAVGATTGDVARQAQNLAAPDFQTERTPEGVAVSAITGGLLGAGMPHAEAPRLDLRPEVKADPIAKIAEASSVDEAIQAAQEAVSTAPVGAEIPAGPTIEQLLAQVKARTETTDVSKAVADEPAVPAAAASGGADDVGGVNAGGLSAEPAGRVGDGTAEPDVSGQQDVAVGGGGGEPAAVEPAVTWFGRAGDGYKTAGDAQMALPSRLKVAPDLTWKIEPMPNGKFRLAGYDDAAVKSSDANADSRATAQPAGVDAGGPVVGESGLRGVPATELEPERGPVLQGLDASDAEASAAGGRRTTEEAAPSEPASTEVAKTPADTGVSVSEPAPEVSRFNGRYGKGMSRDAARMEAVRLNRQNDGVTYAAEEHNDPKLENPYAVVGRRMGHETPDARAIDTGDAERALNDIPRETAAAEPPARSIDDVRAKWDAAGIKHSLIEKDGTIEVGRIEVPKDQRNAGVGTEAMRQLADYADATGKRITLSPSADFGGNKSRLTDFYKRFGFVENKGRSRDFTTRDTMIREPRSGEQNDLSSLPDIGHELQARGELIDSMHDAERRFSKGERLFALHEMGDAPTEIESIDVLRRFTPDQLMALKPEEANDFTRSGGIMDRIAQQGYEKAEVPRVQAARRLSTLLERYDNNKISEGMFQLELKMLSHQMSDVSATKQANRTMDERERGADLVREKLIRARRQGDLDSGTVDFGLWLLDKNPALAEDLGASVRSTEGSSAGRYNPASRVITLFKGKANEGTAVHEILHHSERMMPPEVQKGIADAWSNDFAKAYKDATPEQRAALDEMAKSMAGSKAAHDAVIQAFKDRTLDYDKHYQLTNPSEYWAVNATRIMSDRYAAQSWVGKARQWLGEMVEKAKGAFGLSSDAPIIKGLQSVLDSDGSRQSAKMLSQMDEHGDIKSDEERTAKLADRVGAGYHAYAGVEQAPRESKGTIADSIAKALIPAGRKDASITSGIIRANLGEQAREREVAQQRLMEFAKRFDGMPVEENYKFIDAMERGVPLKDPELARAAVALRKVLDERRDQVIALGKGNLENFNANYFPHIWKDKTAASNFFTRRPLEGGKGFLKQRTYDYFADGLKAGLEPVTTNPVELAMLKAREMDRYIYGQRIFAEMKQAGVAKFVGFGDKPPEGWQKINDKIARVMQYSEAEKGMILRGEYYAPEQAATLINNHLSPGLSGIAAFDMIRKAGNMMNATQLGLSAFHLGFTTLDASISKAALGIKQVSRGDVLKGTGNILQSLNPAQPVMNLIKGDRLLKAYLGNLNDPALAPIVEALVQAGGRVKMDDVYRNAAANEFRQAVRKGNYGTAAMKVLPRVLDLINKPIFEYLVPRQKLGVFFDMAKDKLEEMPNMTLEAKRLEMGKLWDSVDNRMGELVYDNVFWNRALKDALMVSVRSVGWNLGTFREIGGGVKDLKDVRKLGGLSDRSAYIFALPFVTAIIGSITQYLLTGEGPREAKDVFFPRTGKVRPDGTEDRLSLPSYMKDIAEYGHDMRNFAKYGDSPFNTLENKLHPLISTMAQIFTNKDFFGGAIRSPGDTPTQQLLDEADYMLKQFTPFSLRNYQQQAKVKGEEPSIAGYLSSPSMIGITPAPGYITKNDAQAESSQVNRMRESLVTKFREEMRDGADWGEIRQRAMDAGIRGQDLEWIRKAAVQRPPKKTRAFATH